MAMLVTAVLAWMDARNRMGAILPDSKLLNASFELASF